MRRKEFCQKRYPPAVLRDIEDALSETLFHGVPIGPTLNDDLTIGIYHKRHRFDQKQRLMAYLRMIYHAYRIHWQREKVALPRVRPVLLTCLSSFAHIRELMLPVVEAIGKEHCVVACAGPTLSTEIPQLCDMDWRQVVPRAAQIWRSTYLRCLPRWRKNLKYLCRKHHLPKGTYELLALRILVSTQNVAGCLNLLSCWKPSVIVTEFDRNAHWSCLVLAAKAVGIPTVTLVHGTMNENALGYTPVLAEKILCWGRLQRKRLIAEGEKPDKILVAGCPRLTRELPLSARKAREKMGLEVGKPAVMLATNPIHPRILKKTVGAFCAAAQKVTNWTAFVRLHPSEKLSAYRKMVHSFPEICFFDNEHFSLDESLAAADVVVVKDSGVGSDALVKRRLAVVLSVDGPPLGHGKELVRKAGCPLVSSPTELIGEIHQLLFDKIRNRNSRAASEAYVTDFCQVFGSDSARMISEIVKSLVNTETVESGVTSNWQKNHEIYANKSKKIS